MTDKERCQLALAWLEKLYNRCRIADTGDGCEPLVSYEELFAIERIIGHDKGENYVTKDQIDPVYR
jgi:hypothetical protein